MSGYERENRNVLRRCLKTAIDGAAVTWAGRSFHSAAPEAANVRLPTVDRRMFHFPVFAICSSSNEICVVVAEKNLKKWSCKERAFLRIFFR